MNEEEKRLKIPWRLRLDGFKMLYDEDVLRDHIDDLARQAWADRRTGQDLHVVTVLDGARTFADALIPRIIERGVNVKEYVVRLKSYDETESSGEVKTLLQVSDPKTLKPANLNGKEVLVLDDIADTGLTLDELRRDLYVLGAKDVRFMTLLDKKSRRLPRLRRTVQSRYPPLPVRSPNFFLVGFGLDYNERFRHLPFVCYKDTSKRGNSYERVLTKVLKACRLL